MRFAESGLDRICRVVAGSYLFVSVATLLYQSRFLAQGLTAAIKHNDSGPLDKAIIIASKCAYYDKRLRMTSRVSRAVMHSDCHVECKYKFISHLSTPDRPSGLIS